MVALVQPIPPVPPIPRNGSGRINVRIISNSKREFEGSNILAFNAPQKFG